MKVKRFLLLFLPLCWWGSITCYGQERVWEFSVKLSSETSASNYVRVYLDADIPDLAASLHGFYVRVGHDQKQLCLFRQNGLNDSLLIAATPNRLAAGATVRFKVERSQEGDWFLFSDYTSSGTYTYEGQSVEDAVLSGGNSGVVKVCSLPDSVSLSHDQLLVERIPVVSLPAYIPSRYDILINEVMADPDPVVGLPSYEYVELFNRSDQDISLNGWVIKVGATSKTLSSVVIPSGGYLVLTHTDAVAQFPDSIPVAGVFTNVYSITNDASALVLIHSGGDTIDQVNFNINLHTETSKKNGGWSLERDSLSQPQLSLWHSSLDLSGGTPGRPNTIAHVSTDDPDDETPENNYQAQPNDVVINEIMVDPDPAIGLPAYEFVELFNRKDTVISLTGWSFTYGTTVKTFPDCTIPAGGYLLLCHADGKVLMEPFGPTVALFTSKTTLTNDGQTLVLKDDSGTVISSVTYAKSWYGSSAKSEGGWTLEQKDASVESGGAANWSASVDATGGTPGRRNSLTASIPVEPGTVQRFVFTMPSDVFSPNQDGYQDQLEGIFRCEKAGYSVEAAVFNTLGQRIKWLRQNEEIGMEGVISWDGKNDNGVLVSVGAYILYVRFYHPDGTVREYKWPCVMSVSQ